MPFFGALDPRIVANTSQHEPDKLRALPQLRLICSFVMVVVVMEMNGSEKSWDVVWLYGVFTISQVF
jgi:hypothetical protein